MPSTSNRQASIDSRRIALEREVTIRVPRFDTFVTEYSTNISTTGMFIVSEKPHPPGTTFAFEFSVADDWKLIRGKAQVVWTRYRDEDKERPAGMGVRFVELDAQSRRLIRWIVEKHIREGGRPFELDELRNVIDEALEDVIDTEEAGAETASPTAADPAPVSRPRPTARRPPANKQSSSERNVLPLVATAAVIVIGLIFLFWLTEWIPDLDADSGAVAAGEAAGESPRVEDGASDRSGESQASSSASGANDSRSIQPASPVSNAGGFPMTDVSASNEPGDRVELRSSNSPPVGSAYTSVRQALRNWATAWSARDVDGYLASYSRNFRPSGSTRSAWVAERRERLTTPAFIKVSISQLDMVRVQDSLVEATFFQSYRSDRFSDSVDKVVELLWEDGGWKILREDTR